MIQRDRYGHLVEAECARIIGRLLWGTRSDRESAWTQLWVEVLAYILGIPLPQLGPFQRDGDARRDVALGVMERLIADDHAHIRDWWERQRTGVKAAPWWGFINYITKQVATDWARGCRENLAPRADSYEWATVLSEDPSVQANTVADPRPAVDGLGDPCTKILAFLEQCDGDTLDEFLVELEYLFGGKNARRPKLAEGNGAKGATPPGGDVVKPQRSK